MRVLHKNCRNFVKDPLLVVIVKPDTLVFHDHLDRIFFDLLINDATLHYDVGVMMAIFNRIL